MNITYAPLEIRDWANNVCFRGIEFKNFDDAEEWLTLKIEEICPDTKENEKLFSEYRGEYYIGVKE